MGKFMIKQFLIALIGVLIPVVCEASSTLLTPQIDYVDSKLVNTNDGLYAHHLIIRHDGVAAKNLQWTDHASEIRSVTAYDTYLAAIGVVETSAESISILDLNELAESDFVLCREPVASPSGRYISFLQFQPRHFTSDGSASDVVLAYKLGEAVNTLQGISEDEGWVSLAANKGNVIYPPRYTGRVFPSPLLNDGVVRVKARMWDIKRDELYMFVQEGKELFVVIKDFTHSDTEPLGRTKIDLGGVLKNVTDESIQGLRISGFKSLSGNLLSIQFETGLSVKKNQVIVKLQDNKQQKK